MAGRPGTLPWNFATFSGNEPVTTLSDNFSFLNNQINDSGIGYSNFATDTGTANNYVLTLASAPVAYEVGMMVSFVAANTNTGASVINVNALGSISILTKAGVALSGSEISATKLITLIFNGAQFLIQNWCGLSTSPVIASGTNNIACRGYDSVNVLAQWSTVVAPTITLTNLASGTPVQIILANASGSNCSYAITATDPQSNAMTVRTCFPTGTIGSAAVALSSVTLNAGATIIYTGIAGLTWLYLSP